MVKIKKTFSHRGYSFTLVFDPGSGSFVSPVEIINGSKALDSVNISLHRYGSDVSKIREGELLEDFLNKEIDIMITENILNEELKQSFVDNGWEVTH